MTDAELSHGEAEAFEEAYAARSGISRETLLELGLFGAPCDCGEKGCEGWQMVRLGDASRWTDSRRQWLRNKHGDEDGR